MERMAAGPVVNQRAALGGDADVQPLTAPAVTRQIAAKLRRPAREPRSVRETFEDAGAAWNPKLEPLRYAAILHANVMR